MKYKKFKMNICRKHGYGYMENERCPECLKEEKERNE